MRGVQQASLDQGAKQVNLDLPVSKEHRDSVVSQEGRESVARQENKGHQVLSVNLVHLGQLDHKVVEGRLDKEETLDQLVLLDNKEIEESKVIQRL